MSGFRNRSAKQGQVRIIGGQWRGRKLSFPAADGLRPTGDRIRETLFNWLADSILDASCADLFAGSGALGLEALSRGARYCDFVDNSGTALAHIRDHLSVLGACGKSSCHPGAALQFLQTAGTPYDIVFVDPPFQQQLVAPTCAALAQMNLLAPDARVYVEMAASAPPPGVPPEWNLYREKVAGGVIYRLYSIS